MREIPGIEADKIERYGKRFLRLIRASQQRYESMMQPQEDRVQDPNHQNVIDISSDDEFGNPDLDEFEDDNASQEERSSYFRADPDVDAFNAQCEQYIF